MRLQTDSKTKNDSWYIFTIQFYKYDAVSLPHLQPIFNLFFVLKSVSSCIFWISSFCSIRICLMGSCTSRLFTVTHYKLHLESSFSLKNIFKLFVAEPLIIMLTHSAVCNVMWSVQYLLMSQLVTAELSDLGTGSYPFFCDTLQTKEHPLSMNTNTNTNSGRR